MTVCAALGLPEPSMGGTIITGEVLASRVGVWTDQKMALEHLLTPDPHLRIAIHVDGEFADVLDHRLEIRVGHL